jgi:hypothetical protein
VIALLGWSLPVWDGKIEHPARVSQLSNRMNKK